VGDANKARDLLWAREGQTTHCSGARNFGQLMRLIVVSPIDVIESQLQATRNSHFVEDPKQVVTDRVLTQIELLGNVTIGEAFGYQLDDTCFSLSTNLALWSHGH
jgi:hypothetical protein